MDAKNSRAPSNRRSAGWQGDGLSAQLWWRESGRQQRRILELTCAGNLNLQRAASFGEKNVAMFRIVMHDHTALQRLQRNPLPTV